MSFSRDASCQLTFAWMQLEYFKGNITNQCDPETELISKFRTSR